MEEEWRQVKYGKKKRKNQQMKHGSQRKSQLNQSKQQDLNESEDLTLSAEELSSLTSFIHDSVCRTLPKTIYYYQSSPILHRNLHFQASSLILLGIGSFRDRYSSSDSKQVLYSNSFWQLLLGLSIQSILRQQNDNESQGDESPPTYCYDPLLLKSQFDMSLYEGLGIQILQKCPKEESLLHIQDLFPFHHGKKIVYYMPHCPYRLYCNILCSYWNQLDSIVIIGNSFRSYGIRRLPKSDRAEASDIVSILSPFIEEISICSLTNSIQKELKMELEETVLIEEYNHIIQSAFSDLSSIAENAQLQRVIVEKKPNIEDMIRANAEDIELL